MANLVAGLVGALVSLLAVAIGARMQGRREYQHWLRDQKLHAAAEFFAATRYLLNQHRRVGELGMDPEDRRQMRDRMQAARSTLYLLCDKATVELADDVAKQMYRTSPHTSEADNIAAEDA